MNSKKRRSKIQKLPLNDHDTSVTLSDPELVFKTFMECLKEGDYESSVEVLAASLRHLSKAHLERRYHIPRRTVYNLLTKKSVPSLDLVAKVCQAIRQESFTKHG